MEFRGPSYQIEGRSLLQNFGISCTRLEFSTTFHLQTDEQTERVNQILEDMLRACALDYGSSWDDDFPYAEFSYNNSYQASLKKGTFRSFVWKKVQDTVNVG